MKKYFKRFLIDHIDAIAMAVDAVSYQGLPLSKAIVKSIDDKNILSLYLLSIPILIDPKVIINDGEYYTLLKEFYIENSDQNIIARKVIDQYMISYKTSGDISVSVSSKMTVNGSRVGLKDGEKLSIGVTISANIEPDKQNEYIEFANESCLTNMSKFNRSFLKRINSKKKG